MRALTYQGTKDVRVETVPDPELRHPQDLLLRVTATAICGSDLHLYRGKVPGMKDGDILGHEFMGIVEEVGSEVTRVKPGDRVVIPFVIACGACYFCERSLFAGCETTNDGHGAGGQGAAGGFPSLADDDWIWGGSYEAIHTTITHGIRNAEDPDARNTAMPRFLTTGILTAAQVNDVAEHVLGFGNRASDPAAAGRGAVLYAENCVACHGEKGEGNKELGAPRLADQVWLYGSDKASIVHSISYARAGVMPNWGARLDPAIVNMLTVYVHALGGGE